MKIVIFQGGLGNQLFEYVFHQYIKKNIDSDVRVTFRDANSHNGFELAKWFDVSIRMAPFLYVLYIKVVDFMMHKGIIKNPYCNQQNFPYSGNACNEPCRSNIYDGYWQRKMFYSPGAVRFKSDLPVNEKNRSLLKQIESSESISIHVRRGDYLKPQFARTYGGICTEEYYKKAINTVRETLITSQPHNLITLFVVFSDDIDWVKQHLPLDNAVYVDWNTGNDSVYDMYLMSHCKHNIVANSSFSYWGARLNSGVKTVIYPKKWYNGDWTAPNIFPDEWIGI